MVVINEPAGKAEESSLEVLVDRTTSLNDMEEFFCHHYGGFLLIISKSSSLSAYRPQRVGWGLIRVT